MKRFTPSLPRWAGGVVNFVSWDWILLACPCSPLLRDGLDFHGCRRVEPASPAHFLTSVTTRVAACVLRFIFALFLVLGGIVSAEESTSAEYRTKAFFLFNFSQFVEWPKDAFRTPETPLVIGVLGEDPFGKVLDETLQNEVVQSRPLAVKRFRNAKEIDSCHILFISSSEEENLEQIFDALKGKAILTIGESNGFSTRRGGMVRFFTQNNKVRLSINLENVRPARLSISSKLLRVAEIVTNEGRR